MSDGLSITSSHGEKDLPNNRESVSNLTFSDRAAHFDYSTATEAGGERRVGVDVERQTIEKLRASFEILDRLNFARTVSM